jgi:hypothetical protein
VCAECIRLIAALSCNSNCLLKVQHRVTCPATAPQQLHIPCNPKLHSPAASALGLSLLLLLQQMGHLHSLGKTWLDRAAYNKLSAEFSDTLYIWMGWRVTNNCLCKQKPDLSRHITTELIPMLQRANLNHRDGPVSVLQQLKKQYHNNIRSSIAQYKLGN